MISPDQYRLLREGAALVRRDDRGRLVLRGADRLSYLHGLLTNDIQALAGGGSCYAALLTPQGRMITDMRVSELGDLALIDLDATLAAGIREHLDRFVITEDVVVEDASASLGQLGVYGPGASKAFTAVKDRFAPPLYVLPGSDIGVEGFDLVLPADRVDALEAALVSAGAAPVGRDACEVTRVEAGIPRFLVDMDTTTIPLEAGIEERAISMTKGCYVGQEVIVRVLHRGGGRVAKKLVGLVAGDDVRRGDPIRGGEREIGVITSAVRSPGLGAPIALGYVHRDFVEPGTEVWVETNGRAVAARVSALPFARSR